MKPITATIDIKLGESTYQVRAECNGDGLVQNINAGKGYNSYSYPSETESPRLVSGLLNTIRAALVNYLGSDAARQINEESKVQPEVSAPTEERP